MSLITAEDIEREGIKRSEAARRRRAPHEIPRCYCGCGRAALWPRRGKPYFHSRLCGYLMALKMVQRKPL